MKRLLLLMIGIIILGYFCIMLTDRVLSQAIMRPISLRFCQPSNDLIYLAEISGKGEQIWRVDSKYGPQEIMIQSELPKNGVIKSPNHQYIAYTVQVENQKWELRVACASGNRSFVVSQPAKHISFEWLNSDTLFYSSAESLDPQVPNRQVRAFVLKLLSNELIKQEDFGTFWSYKINPSNIDIISYQIHRGEDYWLHNRNSGSNVRILSIGGNGEVEGYWSPDGRYLVFTVNIFSEVNNSTTGEVYQYDLRNSQVYQLTNLASIGGGIIPNHIKWSPDGQSIAFVLSRPKESESGYRNFLYVITTSQRYATDLGVELPERYSFTWSPDSTRIAFVISDNGEESSIFTVTTSRIIWRLTPEQNFVRSLSW